MTFCFCKAFIFKEFQPVHPCLVETGSLFGPWLLGNV